MEKTKKFKWWKHGVIYHIYPRSFCDSNNDGIGDIQGIISKLDYLKTIGVDAVWLSPVYESPKFDFGYDVSDYRNIDEDYGTIDDFRELIQQAHKMDIKIIIDMVLNHTSNQHPWFIESKSSKNNSKRDWYIWKSAEDKQLPNNWKTCYGKPAWQYDKNTDEYYYFSFFAEQPDLNWRNPEVKKAMFAEIKFWLDMGIDGLRLDVINLIAKDKRFRNNPIFFKQFFRKSEIYTRNRNKSIKIVKDLRKMLDSYEDKMTVGEIYTLPPGNSELVARYLSKGKDALHMAFDFSIIFTPWSAKKYEKTLQQIYWAIPSKGWPCIVFSNHDLNRSYSKSIGTKSRKAKAKIKAMLMLTLHGTPFVYYGEEIGMENTYISKKDIQDPLGKLYWPFYIGRDRARTPMQWSSEQFAGFSEVEPWLPVNKNYGTVNVKSQMNDKNSLLSLYIKLIKLRKENIVLQKGKWEVLKTKNKNILGYKRKIKDKSMIVLLNFSLFRQNTKPISKHRIILSTHNRDNSLFDNTLDSYEGVVISPILNNETDIV